MINDEEREKFESIKRSVGHIMTTDPKARQSRIFQDFEWVVAFATILLPPKSTDEG